MDAFDAFESKEAVVDPAAEFLAREQAELAKIENNELGISSNSNDLLDGGFGDSTSHQDPFGGEQLTSQSTEQPRDNYSAISVVDQLVQEPEKIKKWREEQKKRIETKDAEEDVKKKEWKESAKKELDDWYKNRQEQLVKTHENNKAAEAELMAPHESSARTVDWDRIAKYCDFNPKANKNSRDIGRMRSMLLQLKQSPLVR